MGLVPPYEGDCDPDALGALTPDTIALELLAGARGEDGGLALF